MTGGRVFLDACVLFPPLVRGIILSAAGRGIIEPFWSRRVLDEWRLAIARKQGAAAEDEIIQIQEAMGVACPGAMVTPDQGIAETLFLPDPNDVHVAAGAVAADAPAILTFNTRDFPKRVLMPLGLETLHPDGTFWAWLSHHPKEMGDATASALDALEIGAESARSALKRAQLGRFAKAWVGRGL